MYMLSRKEEINSKNDNIATVQTLSESGWETTVPADPENDGNPYAKMYSDIAIDALTGEIVLFGGSAQPYLPGSSTIGYYDDTWLWTGSSWIDASPLDPEDDGNPSVRVYHDMIWDPLRNTVMLLGGGDDMGSPNPSWKYNGPQWEWNSSSWAKVVPDDPESDGNPGDSGLENHTTPYKLALDTDRNRIYAVAHSGATYMSLWEWDGVSWTKRIASDSGANGIPESRKSPGLTYDSARQRLVMYGGTIPMSTRVDELWEWDAGLSAGPGHVLHFSMAEAGLSEEDDMSNLQVTWIAGATGHDNGNPESGVVLHLWDKGTWQEIGSDASASPDAPATLEWQEDAQDQLNYLPQGNDRWISLAVTPAYPNGVDYATLATDYVEVTVTYKKK